MKPGIVSAADAAYFSMFQGLLHSIEACRPTSAEIAFGVLDIGLEPSQIETLHKKNVHVTPAEWDYDFPSRDTTPRWFQAMTARSRLPKYFPDFDPIIWIDADCWLQDWRGVDILLAAAHTDNRLAVVPEMDRCYRHIYHVADYDPEGLLGVYRLAFNEPDARLLSGSPVFNCGVLAARRDADIWDLWSKRLDVCLNRGPNTMSEQSALNAAIYLDGLKFYPLPAWCNWICGQAAPAYDAQNRRLVAPLVPHEPISIVHVTPRECAVMEVVTLGGGKVKLPLEYWAFQEAVK